MRHLIAASFLLFSFYSVSFAQITYNYEQNTERIDSISDNKTLSCQSNSIYEQGNDQIERIHSFKNKSVYIKYFTIGNVKYYVDIREVSDGAFNLDKTTDSTIDESLKK